MRGKKPVRRQAPVDFKRKKSPLTERGIEFVDAIKNAREMALLPYATLR